MDAWFNKYAAMVLAAAIGLGGYQWVCWRSLTASDYGTWVGAIGTAGGVIGALAIYSAQDRSTRRKERIIAKIAAASSVHDVISLHSLLRHVMLRGGQFRDDVEMEDFSHLAKYVLAIPILETATLIQLSALPNRCAEHLASGTASVVLLRSLFHSITEKDYAERTYDYRKSMAETARKYMTSAMEPLGKGLKELEAALAAEGDA